MNAVPFHMKLTRQDQRLFSLLMAKHRLPSKSDLVRQALIFFAKAPVLADPMSEALADLERFEASAEQSQKHRAVKKEVVLGRRRGLDKTDSLALLDKLQKAGRD